MKPSPWIVTALITAAATAATSARPARADDADERNNKMMRDHTFRELAKSEASFYDADGRPTQSHDNDCDGGDVAMEHANGDDAVRGKLPVAIKTPHLSWAQGEEHSYGELKAVCAQWRADLASDKLAADVASAAAAIQRSPDTFIGSCLRAYDRARAANVADAQPAFVQSDSDNPLHSGKHTVGELHAYCLQQQQQHADQDAAERLTSHLVGAAASMLQLTKKVQDSPGADLTMIDGELKRCNEAVDQAIAAKAPSELAIVVDGNSEVLPWKGTLGTMRAEVCERGAAAVKKAYDQHYGPYIKAGLKNDKLRFVIENYPGGYWLPGGAYSDNGETDAGKLARANVWYSISYGEDCTRGKTYIFHRFTFGKDQKVAKETVTSYCGDPGKKALK